MTVDDQPPKRRGRPPKPGGPLSSTERTRRHRAAGGALRIELSGAAAVALAKRAKAKGKTPGEVVLALLKPKKRKKKP